MENTVYEAILPKDIIDGLNTIKYNDEVTYPDKVRINLDYYRHHSLIGDLRYIVETIVG